MSEAGGEETSVEEIAEEIRRAIPASAAPGIGRPEESSRALEAAGRHLVPGLEPGTKFALAKRYLLRLLRIVTRSQGTYNAAMLEAARELDQKLRDTRREAEELRRQLSGLDRKSNQLIGTLADIRHAQEVALGESQAALELRFENLSREAALEAGRFRTAVETDFERLRQLIHSDSSRLARDIDLIHARLSREERSMASAEQLSAPAAASLAAPAAGFPDGFYIRFEDRFRGSEENIRARQELYASYFRDSPGPVLDCGCGRGEFLEVLRANGVASRGVDSNAIAVELAAGKGLDVRLEDLFASLRRRGSELGGVAALQVVEHFDPAAVYEFLELAFAALAPGGRLLLETINPDSVYALKAFRLDPTHRWPVPAATLELMAREAGFESRRVEMLSPVPDSERLAEEDENDRRLNRLLFAPQDYALFAERPR